MKLWLGLLLGMFGGTPVAATPPRTEIPITAVTLSDGARRYTIPVTVGGVTLAAGFDTGSTGLRVLAPATPTLAEARGPHSNYAYSGGVTIAGVLLSQHVEIGGIGGKVPFQRIDTIGCLPHKPDCPGNRLPIAEFGIQGDGLKGEGFPAIIGLSMGASDATNPLIALGATRWIVELPRPGDSAPGRLIIQPSDDEVARYDRIGLIAALRDRRGGIHDGIAGCLVRTDTQTKTCGPIRFDSGAPGIRISLPGAAVWPRATPGLLVVGDTKIQRQLAFVSGRRDQATGMSAEEPMPNAAPRISVGLMPYLSWSVLYDVTAQAIGVKPRD